MGIYPKLICYLYLRSKSQYGFPIFSTVCQIWLHMRICPLMRLLSLPTFLTFTFGTLLGIEPRTLEFEVQVSTTLATEARLGCSLLPSICIIAYSQGFALASIARSSLPFCPSQKPHFGASYSPLPRSQSFPLVARRPVIVPYFFP